MEGGSEEQLHERNAALIASWAQKGAQLGADCGRMCNECAFKTGSITQRAEPHNVEAAITSLMWEGIFNCHVDDYHDAGRPCAGFLYAKKYFESHAADE